MKIIVLHGDDTEKSYGRLQKFVEVAKERSWEVIYMDDSPQSFEEVLSATSLFGGERFFILRDIKKLGKKETSWLNKKYPELSGNLIIYHDGLLNVTFLKSLPKDIKIEEFKLPVLLWNFLDNLTPGYVERNIKTLHKIIEKQPIEFIFSLIAKQFRDLYWAKIGATGNQIPGWKLLKFKTAASKFSEEQLKEIIGKLSEIDIKVKTSRANLTDELDLLILKHLE